MSKIDKFRYHFVTFFGVHTPFRIKVSNLIFNFLLSLSIAAIDFKSLNKKQNSL